MCCVMSKLKNNKDTIEQERMNAISQAEPKAKGYNIVGTGEHEEAERSRALALLLENIGGKHWSPISFSSDTGTTRSNSSVALSVRAKIQGLKRSER